MLRGAWLIIAGVLLLSHAPALATPKIIMFKKGGVYYISSREQPQANQAVKHISSLQWLPYNPQARPVFPGDKRSITVTDQPHNLLPQLIKAVNRLDSRSKVQTASAKGVPNRGQLRLGKAHDLQIGNASDPQENMWTAPRYLGRLWAKTGWRSPLALAASDPAPQQPDLFQNHPPLQEIQAQVRDACKNLLAYTQAVPPGPDFLADSNHLSYCFPVAPPYSFRDTWGDWRSGGRFHHAVDIVAADGTPVYAITSGVIHTLATWDSAGISLLLRGQDGRVFGYMHLQGYAEGIVEGKPVKKGDLIAYVGHTGIKRDAAHLHLQVYADDSCDRDKLVNPYGLLVQLSNGKGVADWSPPAMARRQIPAADVVNVGSVTLSGPVPRRYQPNQPKIVDASTWLPNTY
ncbi:MAG: M23 family metallopeptidase [Deltaproteobacteria bacterium]|nr:M23 family metallopeptidase [Deltaproteobacteria bacterium]